MWYCSEECNVAGWNSKVNPHKAVCEAEQARLAEEESKRTEKADPPT